MAISGKILQTLCSLLDLEVLQVHFNLFDNTVSESARTYWNNLISIKDTTFLESSSKSEIRIFLLPVPGVWFIPKEGFGFQMLKMYENDIISDTLSLSHGERKLRIQSFALALFLGKFSNLSEPYFPPLKNGDNYYHPEIKWIIYLACFIQCFDKVQWIVSVVYAYDCCCCYLSFALPYMSYNSQLLGKKNSKKQIIKRIWLMQVWNQTTKENNYLNFLKYVHQTLKWKSHNLIIG